MGQNESHEEDMLAKPYTKVEYDLHGFIQNVYYRVPGTTDQYQLSPPFWHLEPIQSDPVLEVFDMEKRVRT